MSIMMSVEVIPADVDTVLGMAQSASTDPYVQPHETVAFIRRSLEEKSLRLADQLQLFVQGEASVALLIRGLPSGIAEEVRTPTDQGAVTMKGNSVSELVLLTIACILGEPFAFDEEQGGSLVNNLFPMRSTAGLQISTSASELTLHVDAAASPTPPDFTVLLCLRGGTDARARTFFSAMRPAVGALPERDQAVLRMPRFMLSPEPVYGAAAPVITPVWSTVAGRDVFRFDESLLRGIDAECQRIVDALKPHLETTSDSVLLSDGEMLVIKNLEAVHGRATYEARYDGTDRWLQRAYVWRGSGDVDAGCGRIS
jgi:L-asparagine oxygenase